MYEEDKEEYEMLKENINRMFVTDDTGELYHMYQFVLKRLDRIYQFQRNRILNKENGQEGETANG